jgi:hypothetical protein
MKKIIVSIICVCMLTLCVLPVFAEEDVLDFKEDLKIINKIDNFVNENSTLGKYAIATAGPILKRYTEINLLEGPTLKIKQINRNLNRRLLRLSIVLPVLLIRVEKLDFTLYYRQDLKNNSRFSYATLFGEAIYDEEGNYVDITNETYYHNKINKINVENFTGFFIFIRTRAFRLIPIASSHRLISSAQFIFTGFCDNITEIPI